MSFPSVPVSCSFSPVDLGDGVHLVDANYVRPGVAAIYIVVGDSRVAIVETGTRHAVPRVLDALERLAIPREAVAWVIPTHVHLDHAGGAGALMAALPSARLLVHPRGLRHLIDPARLWAGTVDVYGEPTARALYGELLPVAAERVDAAQDGLVVDLGGRALQFFDTPGHARHHVCILDSRSRCLFTGDTFGMSYRELDVDGRPSALITTTPTQFDPAAMRHSLARLCALQPRGLFLTHFSRVDAVEDFHRELIRQLDQHVAIARRHQGAPAGKRPALIEQDLRRFFQDEAARRGWRLDAQSFDAVLGTDLRLNAQGLAHWLASAAVAA